MNVCTHLARAEDRHTADLALEPDALICRALQYPNTVESSLLRFSCKFTYRWGHYRLWYHREMVQPLFDEKPDDSVGVEQEITPARLLVPDDCVQRFQLRRLRQRKYRRW